MWLEVKALGSSIRQWIDTTGLRFLCHETIYQTCSSRKSPRFLNSSRNNHRKFQRTKGGRPTPFSRVDSSCVHSLQGSNKKTYPNLSAGRPPCRSDFSTCSVAHFGSRPFEHIKLDQAPLPRCWKTRQRAGISWHTLCSLLIPLCLLCTLWILY